jgi:hypothetical protein
MCEEEGGDGCKEEKEETLHEKYKFGLGWAVAEQSE